MSEIEIVEEMDSGDEGSKSTIPICSDRDVNIIREKIGNLDSPVRQVKLTNML
eukprot:gene7692-8529_t